MQANKTVTINGRIYDAVTGLPVEKKVVSEPSKLTKPAPTKHVGHVSASTVHSSLQRSQTLNRRATKKPEAVAKRPRPGRHMDISRSRTISRFAPHPASSSSAKKAGTPDIKPRTHPAVVKAIARTTPVAKPIAKTSKQIKEAAISAALATPTVKPIKQKRLKWRWSRRSTTLTTIFALLIVGGILTYINLPGLSVSFASTQAGIKATYPEYRPDGYSLSQPVTFSDGEVTLVFKSNSSDTGYTIVQTRSSWDSSAVLDNVVRKTAGDNYVTTQEKGLIIYTYDQNAAWVNGGILYEIDSTAPLSGEQIRHIATSL